MFKALIGWCLERKFDYHDWRLNSACKIYLKARQKKEYHIERLKGLARRLENYNEVEVEEFEEDVRDLLKFKWKKDWGEG